MADDDDAWLVAGTIIILAPDATTWEGDEDDIYGAGMEPRCLRKQLGDQKCKYKRWGSRCNRFQCLSKNKQARARVRMRREGGCQAAELASGLRTKWTSGRHCPDLQNFQPKDRPANKRQQAVLSQPKPSGQKSSQPVLSLTSAMFGAKQGTLLEAEDEALLKWVRDQQCLQHYEPRLCESMSPQSLDGETGVKLNRRRSRRAARLQDQSTIATRVELYLDTMRVDFEQKLAEKGHCSPIIKRTEVLQERMSQLCHAIARAPARKVMGIKDYNPQLRKSKQIKWLRRKGENRSSTADAGPAGIVQTYHGTVSVCASSITKEGLKLPGSSSHVTMRNGQCYGSGIYSAKDLGMPLTYARGSQASVFCCALFAGERSVSTHGNIYVSVSEHAIIPIWQAVLK
ncbi:uncharacterized protein MONBRDRAFT_5151 [Monosiga brevicollis MX1]|uniref:PARP catalytic domain-containing protein n=1 Tax=Monosiga brevicollis TaxID=81824 RepID=A9UQ27_MONBE|nr:uncharacterized protein MONBRDRAFT_5151 [Monosiga brevicollis MX1]EDQ92524.1 predicted protein [Monosiga brevicollis MX1]|eukprot:XP_001742286.1 hypothetical protein [Monosiga brevicollis MX1]